MENRFDHGDRKEDCPSGMRLVAEKGHIAKPCSAGDGIDAAEKRKGLALIDKAANHVIHRNRKYEHESGQPGAIDDASD